MALAALICAVGALLVIYRGAQTPWEPSLATFESGVPFAQVVDGYRATHDFDGVGQVRINGSVVYELTSGVADEEFDVSMTQESIFPVNINSKLFVSVSLYQLQERGFGNLSEHVDQYLDQHDFANFGFPNQTHWCPRVRGAWRESDCELITFVQLMHMGSGIGDSITCDNVDVTDCHSSVENLAYFRGSLIAHVGIFINYPLVFKPGTNYSYSNPNYISLSYMVEKISGVRLEKYFRNEIADKIGLKHTYFDPYSGGLDIRKGFLFDRRGTASKVLSAESIRLIFNRTNPFNPVYGQGIAVSSLRQDG